ncbi:MAG: hypothetical protein JF602_02765 [Gemmatimonadetes bacterium]|jgi:hypothetical protein|nr:hypothetical protein [Gemmatimonadota bacterium]
MRPKDTHLDREMARALRRLDPPAATPAQMASLARRIVSRATPMLDARRRSAARWWEYAADWAGTLLPLGAAAAFVATACLAWSSAARAPVRQHAVERTALLRVVTNRAPSGDLLDYVLDAHSAEHRDAPSNRETR